MYIVLETHGGPEYAIVCMNEEGSNIVFDSEDKAVHYAENECQDGQAVHVF